MTKTNNIDKSNMKQTIINFPNQLEEALEFSKNVKIEGTFDNIIVCGLGGSALPGNVLACWLGQSKITAPTIHIHRDYGLPMQIKEGSLIVCMSYSGNTEETLSAINEALAKNLTVAAITTGGKLEKINFFKLFNHYQIKLRILKFIIISQKYINKYFITFN